MACIDAGAEIERVFREALKSATRLIVRGALTAEQHFRLALLLPRHALLAQPQDLVARLEP